MTLLQSILREVPFEKSELIAIISTAPRRYKVYQIPKREKGTFRTIAQPAPEVKLLQLLIVEKVISTWPTHEAATAYRASTSILEHASRHVNSRYLLKLDFSNFFPSITANDLRLHAKKHSTLEEADLNAVINILAWREKSTGRHGLSIGAPSSPAASNSIMFEFDTKISDYCKSLDVRYSRYADDLAFSTDTPDTLSLVHTEVKRLLGLIEYPRLFINEAKTANVSRRHNRTLVGLTLTPDKKVSLGRERKKDIRAQLYLFGKGYLSPEATAHLRGLIAFAWSIEPKFVLTLAEKQGNHLFEKLELPFRFFESDSK